MFTIKEIQKITRGKLINGCSCGKIKGISIDTRSLRKGEAYVAIQGIYQDGHDFIFKALEKKAGLLIVSRPSLKGIPEDVPVLLVQDTTKSLGAIAKVYRSRFRIPVIAITGSAGKTTTKELIAQVLSARYRVLKNHASFNNQWGVPLTLLNLRAHHQAAVIEIGTNFPGEIAYLADIVRPTMAVFTNIGPAHLKGLGSIEAVYKEKTSLLKFLVKKGCVVFNEDDPYLRKLKSRKEIRALSYGTNPQSGIQLKSCFLNKRCIFEGTVNRSLKLRLHTPVVENMKNALAAIACGRLLGLQSDQILKSLEKFRFSNARQDIERVRGITVINDTYNANPLSFKSAVRTLAAIPVKGKRIAVCADMLELGDMSRKLHEELGEFLAQCQIDVVLAHGAYMRFMASVFEKHRSPNSRVKHYSRVSDIGRALSSLCAKGDVVLIKGSRSMKMERVVAYLKSRV
ncbi:MAG TPA: UDP-N-acetylmuramoyl-tripeptide--D-alanyl-D-alanine ligase [Candidatus Omnitrophota bacterium]|nr:UDP-N-acetylmuramoyl-tripeptide--D-alanyl-D-alanine ligase [Candidatus Omnitrophota bacterium]